MISEPEFILRLAISFILTGIVGYEREISLKPAGLRTHVLVGLGSTVFTALSCNAFPGGDPARMASSVIIGIGFIGAGTIIKTKKKIIGLTTASTLWITSAIGVAIGAGYYLVGVFVSLITFLVLKLGTIEKMILD
jgi:putative Mg2+ transporter-C (MgtC) family protein